MQNISGFWIIGRAGKINIKDKVAFLKIASNYGRKVNGEWGNDIHWNRITRFGKNLERAENINSGDLIHITGRLRQNSFERDGEAIYTVDLITERSAILVKNDKASED